MERKKEIKKVRKRERVTNSEEKLLHYYQNSVGGIGERQ